MDMWVGMVDAFVRAYGERLSLVRAGEVTRPLEVEFFLGGAFCWLPSGS